MHPKKKGWRKNDIRFYQKACHGAQILMDQVRYAIAEKQNETLTIIQVRKMNNNTDKIGWYTKRKRVSQAHLSKEKWFKMMNFVKNLFIMKLLLNEKEKKQSK